MGHGPQAVVVHVWAQWMEAGGALIAIFALSVSYSDVTLMPPSSRGR